MRTIQKTMQVVAIGMAVVSAQAAESAKKPETPPAPAELTNPSGSYQVAWPTLENGLPGGKDFGPGALPLFLGLRDGKCVQAWSVTAKIRFNWFGRIRPSASHILGETTP